MEDIKMSPRFSIIVPLYNKAPYVKKALESVVSQTNQDWELIIVDDGSTDGSADVASDVICAFKMSDLRFQILRQKNAGVAAARNKGVKESKGDYLCFLDADDWWEPTFLEEMDKLIRDYPDAGIYATNYVYYKPGKTHVALKLQRGCMNYPAAYLYGEMPIWTGATCMPRKVFEEMGGFPVGIKLGEDFLLWAKTAIHYKVAFCEKPLAYYNNDVPATMRATRNIHAPEHHMLFNLEPLLEEINRLQSTSNKSLWLMLIDKLRVNGLMDYWLDERYHDASVLELAMVDWSKQPKKIVRQYKTPIWALNVKRCFMSAGSNFKQKIVRILCK